MRNKRSVTPVSFWKYMCFGILGFITFYILAVIGIVIIAALTI